jgi:hypothetical protein
MLRYSETVATERAEAEFRRAAEAVEWLFDLGVAVVTDPILVNSGQWEATYDHPRTYADVQAETASNLVGLPKYHAYCRLLQDNQGVEHMIHTPEYDPVTVTSDIIDAIERMRDHSRAVYCAPLEDVVEDIRKRQRGDESLQTATVRRAELRVASNQRGSSHESERVSADQFEVPPQSRWVPKRPWPPRGDSASPPSPC